MFIILSFFTAIRLSSLFFYILHSSARLFTVRSVLSKMSF